VPLISSRYQDERLPHVGRTPTWLSSSSPHSHSPHSNEPAVVASASGRCAAFGTSLVHSVQAAQQCCAPKRQSKTGPREAPHVITSTSTVSTTSPAAANPSAPPPVYRLSRPFHIPIVFLAPYGPQSCRGILHQTRGAPQAHTGPARQLMLLTIAPIAHCKG
jgi:hypothetical protein